MNPFATTKTNAVELDNIIFEYEKGKEILNLSNISIEQGKKIAIVGASGSGKTTLAHLIVGLYPLTKGDIKFDNISIKDIGLDIVQDNVYLVLQNPQLFNDTIKRNLTLGEEIPLDQIKYALKVAQLDSFIETLQDGLETQIGKHGIRLSGGQRQRLSIARMVIQNPNVVILDESTSALDVHTESKLFEALENYLENKTTIIIAHRLSTVRKADYIYVLDNGIVVEKGNIKELESKEGFFSSAKEKGKEY